ncbi:phage tail sheath subtilisin-like domain-containing protein [Myxococcota bacterium]|jgi:phage tail sheath protein FI|nr:phage tail sheath subtilisin-like domain-containing protein [Myxococcota bacterium]
MEYKTPGVYIREVDSGPKPIESVATSNPGFIGLFPFNPPSDATAVTGSDGARELVGKVAPQLVDATGKVNPDSAEEAGSALVTAFRFKSRNVKDVKKLLELNGHKVTFGPGSKGRVKIQDTKTQAAVEVAEVVVNAEGKVVTEDDQLVEELLNNINATFAIDKPKPKHAKDLFEVYGYSFKASEASALQSEYSIPPVAVTNKSEFFRWLQSYFAEYLLSTRSIDEIVGQSFEDPDEAADAVFEALARDPALKNEFQEFLSQPSVFNFVAGVNGFYDNGGGKCYVYLMGVKDLDCSIRENQADKLGLYAFDDIDDMAMMVAPGLNANQQREMLEMCEIRKDRFAILDGPIVSDGSMDIPASQKGFGALYVPWVKVTKPSWFKGDQAHIKVTGPNRRKLIKAEKNELFVPPSGHMAGIYARVDGERGVHKAPANELVMGITGLSQNVNRIEQAQYNERGINVIRIFKDRGIRVWGARTLGTKNDPSWKYINVRRLFIMIEQSILIGSQWAVFEPNDHSLWKKLVRDVRSYLMRVWRSGALFGTTPEEAFYVKCDDETNPRYLIDAGQVNVQIGICPVKPAEFVIFSIGQWDGGALIEE